MARWLVMRLFLLKLLKNGVPTAAFLALLGYLFAQFAGMWYQSEAGGRTAVGASEIADTLEWRLPLTMAAWGLGLVALFEGILSIWRKPAAPVTPPAANAVDETEQLLLQLLEAADAAEAERQSRIALAQTPLPQAMAERMPAESRSV